MRALSLRQAATCENAKNKPCRCRCGGLLHGKARLAKESAREEFEQLPEGDAHKLPPRPEKKARR